MIGRARFRSTHGACAVDGTTTTSRRYPGKCKQFQRRNIMGLGRGALLWLLGIPLPIILLLAFFWH